MSHILVRDPNRGYEFRPHEGDKMVPLNVPVVPAKGDGYVTYHKITRKAPLTLENLYPSNRDREIENRIERRAGIKYLGRNVVQDSNLEADIETSDILPYTARDVLERKRKGWQTELNSWVVHGIPPPERKYIHNGGVILSTPASQMIVELDNPLDQRFRVVQHAAGANGHQTLPLNANAIRGLERSNTFRSQSRGGPSPLKGEQGGQDTPTESNKPTLVPDGFGGYIMQNIRDALGRIDAGNVFDAARYLFDLDEAVENDEDPDMNGELHMEL